MYWYRERSYKQSVQQRSTLSFYSGGFHVETSHILGMGNAAISEKHFLTYERKNKIQSLELKINYLIA